MQPVILGNGAFEGWFSGYAMLLIYERIHMPTGGHGTLTDGPRSCSH